MCLLTKPDDHLIQGDPSAPPKIGWTPIYGLASKLLMISSSSSTVHKRVRGGWLDGRGGGGEKVLFSFFNIQRICLKMNGKLKGG